MVRKKPTLASDELRAQTREVIRQLNERFDLTVFLDHFNYLLTCNLTDTDSLWSNWDYASKENWGITDKYETCMKKGVTLTLYHAGNEIWARTFPWAKQRKNRGWHRENEVKQWGELISPLFMELICCT